MAFLSGDTFVFCSAELLSTSVLAFTCPHILARLHDFIFVCSVFSQPTSSGLSGVFRSLNLSELFGDLLPFCHFPGITSHGFLLGPPCAVLWLLPSIKLMLVVHV